ncbi:polysaccharide deacetylase family protein [Amphibacillus marinus]|nr:polysaccharide deacetylase family protein [Amphibacillus marinus]
MELKVKQLILFFFAALLLLGCASNGTDEAPELPNEEPDDSEEVSLAPELDEDDSIDNDAEDEEIDSAANLEEEFEMNYEVNQVTWTVEPINEEVTEQVVLLTIDDAPDKHALEMAQVLADLDAPAIFFVNGHFLQTEDQRQVLKQIFDLGFMIGNHTYSHPNLNELTEEEQRKEIVELNNLVEDIIGERPKFFRAPFGVNTDSSNQIVEEENMVKMNWTQGHDWEAEYQDKDALVNATLSAPELRNGANLLMHDRTWTYEALPEIVEGLREQGYKIINPKQIQTLAN